MTVLNVAVIGSNGFIARHLVRKLKSMPGINLFLFGRSEKNFFNDLPYKPINFHDPEKLKSDFSEIDIVYHMVSETIPSTSWEDPMIEIEKNLIPFTKFLNILTRTRVKKIAFISSAGTVYGTTTGKVSEDSDKSPFSPYGIIKLTMENLLRYYHSKCGLNYDIYRVSNVYGEGQDTSKGLGIINTFLEKIIDENKVVIFGDGESTRNYIYAEDVANLVTHSVIKPGTSGIYNIASDSTLSINELIGILRKTVREEFKLQHEKGRQSDNKFIDLDNSRILSEFPGFRFTDINEGINKTYLSLKQQKIKN
jgi:UDP-glucose 4-epimerase